MDDLIRSLAGACALAIAGAACSSQSTNPAASGGTSGVGGTAGSSGGGPGGAIGGDAGADAASDPCGPLMFKSGSVCIDKQPALHADGSQGAAVAWNEAVTICEARGARLCTEAEREAACPNGQYSLDPTAKEMYCGGPANTWEWSSSTSCADGRCKSPCCNSVTNPCHCSVPPTETLGYRCCKSL